MPIETLVERYPDAAIGVVNIETRAPEPLRTGGFKNWPEPIRPLKANEIWAVVPGSMGFVVEDIDYDHALAFRLLVAEFGEPAAKVKSHHKGFHWWYPSQGEIGDLKWLCGDVRGTNGYIVLWHLEELLEQLEDHKCLRRLNLADLLGAASLKTKPKTKIDTMLSHVEPDDYKVWTDVGMALQFELGNGGLAVWEEWSRKSDKFKEGDCGKKWRGFNDEGGITDRTLYWYAIEGGYKPAGGRPMAAGGTLPTLDRIVRVGAGAELMWELTTGDTTVRVTQAGLTNQARFRNTWHAHTGEMVRVKQAEWDAAVEDWWSRAEVESAPSLDSLIWAALEDFCTDSQAMDMDALLVGAPYTDKDGMTWFRAADFRLYLVHQRINLSIQAIWSSLRLHVVPVKKEVAIKGKRVRVVGVPAFDQQTEAFSVPKIAEAADF